MAKITINTADITGNLNRANMDAIRENFDKTEKTINQNDDEFKKHKGIELNAHSASQITTLKFKTIEDELFDLHSQLKNMVLGANGDGIAEVKQARVDGKGKTHEVLADRVKADYQYLDDTASTALVAHAQDVNFGGSYKNYHGFYANNLANTTINISAETTALGTITLKKAKGKASKIAIEQPSIAERIPVMNRRAGQDFYEAKSGYTYVAYGVDGDKTLYFERFDRYGNYKDRMRLESPGHGSSLFVTTDNGKDYIWTNFDKVESGKTTFRFAKIPYQSGTVTETNAGAAFYETFYDSAAAYGCLDEEGDRVAFIYKISNGHMVETRIFSEWLQGINNVLGRFEIYMDSKYQPHQSIDIIDDMIFWHYGKWSASPDDKKTGVVIFDWDGTIISDVTIKQSNVFNTDAFNFYEPEGIQVKRTNVPYVYDLLLGYAVGENKTEATKHLQYYKTRTKAVAAPVFEEDEITIDVNGRGLNQLSTILPKELGATAYLAIDPSVSFFKVDKGDIFKGRERGLTKNEVETMIYQAVNSARFHYSEKVIFEGEASGIGETFYFNDKGNSPDFDELKIYWFTEKVGRRITVIDNWKRDLLNFSLDYTNVSDQASANEAQIYECNLYFDRDNRSFTITRDVRREFPENQNYSGTHFTITRIVGINK